MTRSFTSFEIYPVRLRGDEAEVCDEGQQDFFSIYGVLEGEVNTEHICLGDFSSLDEAKTVVGLLAGN
jgi:hypothetical protein